MGAQLFAEAIDLARYPIGDLSSQQCINIMRQCHADLKANGAAILPGFLTPTAISKIVSETSDIESLQYRSEDEGNAYLATDIDPALAADHPMRWTGTSKIGVLAYDKIPQTNLIRQIYEWQPFIDFLSIALNRGPLYRYNCELGALNLAVMPKGDHCRWHFDQSNFVVSIAIQQSQSGGEFEFAPYIRSDEKPNYEGVKAVLEGSDRSQVQNLCCRAGSLVLFEGKQTLHRVTEITGDRQRIMALMGYVLTAGVGSSPYLKRIRYGRES